MRKQLFVSLLATVNVQAWITGFRQAVCRQQQCRTLSRSLSLSSFQSAQHEILSSTGDDLAEEEPDNRPFVQRVKERRPARRLNHAFKYLYRHDFDDNTTLDAATFLETQGGYSAQEVLEMNRTFPPLLDLSVQRQLFPKMQFLKKTLGVNNPSAASVPAQYFGARLERILAPRHAFLVHHNLPHGAELFTTVNEQTNKTLWQEFLSARQAKQFAALCRSWQKRFVAATFIAGGEAQQGPVTHKQIEAFDALFARGLMAAARNELVQANNSWPLDHVSLSSADLIRLLVQHGAPLQERDHRGVTLLHWACGTGNLEGVKELVRLMRLQESASAEDCMWLTTERDGATPLHWAVAGSTAREFGCGGHVEVCRYLLSQIKSEKRRTYVNQCTLDGNSALMWASWSGTLETVKLMVRYRADANTANRNGCTVAHWAASGGNVEVCKYLAEIAGVDFSIPNNGGNTPLTHAVAFGREEVVAWLRETLHSDEAFAEDSAAYSLAQDFVQWTEGDDRRRQVLELFED